MSTPNANDRTTLILLGAGGDLTERLLLPGLGEVLSQRPEGDLRLIGAARSERDDWADIVRDSLREAGIDPEAPAVRRLVETTTYLPTDATDPDDLARTARPVVEGGGRVVVRAAGVPPRPRPGAPPQAAGRARRVRPGCDQQGNGKALAPRRSRFTRQLGGSVARSAFRVKSPLVASLYVKKSTKQRAKTCGSSATVNFTDSGRPRRICIRGAAAAEAASLSESLLPGTRQRCAAPIAGAGARGHAARRAGSCRKSSSAARRTIP